MRSAENGVSAFAMENMWYVWLMAAGFMLIRKVTIYQSFVRYVKDGEDYGL